MKIEQATRKFEEWLGRQVELQADELDYKHQQMASDDPFPFFRGTYYRWVQVWPEVCPELQKGPRVLSVGDLHIENFGTWRDSDARLVWGINDFDEADELPWANDLVRLASSAWFAIHTGLLEIGFGKACRCFLDGYLTQLTGAAEPFVLEESHPELRRLAMHEERSPVAFWEKLHAISDRPKVRDPDLLAALQRALPESATQTVFRRRTHVGMGSLGKPRAVAIATYNGGAVAREAKALCGPATRWFDKAPPIASRITEVLSKVIRSPDPLYRTDGAWIVRRLAPHCSRIELSNLTKNRELTRVLKSMGAETANIHLGSSRKASRLADYAQSLPKDWLEDSAKRVSKVLVKDWKSWRHS